MRSHSPVNGRYRSEQLRLSVARRTDHLLRVADVLLRVEKCLRDGLSVASSDGADGHGLVAPRAGHLDHVGVREVERGETGLVGFAVLASHATVG